MARLRVSRAIVSRVTCLGTWLLVFDAGFLIRESVMPLDVIRDHLDRT